MRFLHSADWQIGMRAAHVGAAAERVRQERLAAARRLIQAARLNRADFILLAGDTFEDNAVDRVLVQKVADILAEFAAPVYVIPGNHDPLAPGCVWDHPAWRALQLVRVLRQAQPVEIPGGLLYPCPVTERCSARDPTAWIPPERSGAIRIGLAHGSLEGVPQDEPDYPIPRDAPVRAALDYLALGHWHSTATYVAADGAVRMAYSGTHEPTKFGEPDSGHALLVEIASPGAPPQITRLRTGGLVWTALERDLRAPGDLLRLRQQVEAMPEPAATLLEVRLGGLLFAPERDELARLEQILAARFLFARLDWSRLRPAPEDDAWLTALPDGVVREAAARLRQLADPAFPGPRPEGADPEVASRALLELFALAAEVAS